MPTKEQLEAFSLGFGKNRDAARDQQKQNLVDTDEERKKRRKYLQERNQKMPAQNEKEKPEF